MAPLLLFGIAAVVVAPGRWQLVLGVLGIEFCGLLLGFGAGLLATRNWLPNDRRIEGWPTAVAGVGSVLLLGGLSVFIQGASLVVIGMLGILAGIVMALLLLAAMRLTSSPANGKQ